MSTSEIQATPKPELTRPELERRLREKEQAITSGLSQLKEDVSNPLKPLAHSLKQNPTPALIACGIAGVALGLWLRGRGNSANTAAARTRRGIAMAAAARAETGEDLEEAIQAVLEDLPRRVRKRIQSEVAAEQHVPVKRSLFRVVLGSAMHEVFRTVVQNALANRVGA